MWQVASKALSDIRYKLFCLYRYRSWTPSTWWPRPGYCACCGYWAWLNGPHAAPYSAHRTHMLCEECTQDNDTEWDRIWSEYYSGLL